MARSFPSPRAVLILGGAFLLGAGSAEVALRTHGAIERVRHERTLGAVGELVQLQLSSAAGEVIARPRVIAPIGKRTELVLHDPARPGEVRLAFRIEASREPSGDVALHYAIWIPDRAVSAHGRISVTPGVEQEISLADGALTASFLALPVPSAAFDAYLEGEGARRAADRTS